MFLIKERMTEDWVPIGFFMEAKDRDWAFENYVLPRAKVEKTWVKKDEEIKRWEATQSIT